jgi:hypothetical protein
MPVIVTWLISAMGGFDPAHLVDQGRIVGREPRDLGFDPAMRQAAAQPLDQPSPEGVKFGDLRYVDRDIGPGSGELFGGGHHRFQSWRKAGGPRARSKQRESVAACDLLQCRIAAHACRLLRLISAR